MGILIIIPCAKRKIWDRDPRHGPEVAREAYVSPTFRVYRSFAEKFAGASPDRWIILSAKHGFIDPDDVIPRNYDVSFYKASPERISMEELKKNAKRRRLFDFELVIALGGEHYRERAKEVFTSGQKVITPTKGKPRPEQPKYVKFLTNLNREEMIQRIVFNKNASGNMR